MEQLESVTQEEIDTENVIIALQKVIALLDRIKTSIEESSSKIPRASVQLSNVTKATEMATVEILDVLDVMGNKISTIESGLNQFESYDFSNEQLLLLNDIKKNLTELKNDTNNITVALQIQDITAQKIGAANHLIESVRNELLHELNYFETAKKKTDSAKRHVASTKDSVPPLDGDVMHTKSPEHQKKIDEVVSEWQRNNSK